MSFRCSSISPNTRSPPSAFVHDLFRDDRTNILFVGRIAPNKRIENLIRIVFYYKKYISPLVRLIVVGKTVGASRTIIESLVRMADEFYLKPEEIVFPGHVPDEEMFALYRAVRRLPVPERARGLLPAARREHGLRPAHRRLRLRRPSRSRWTGPGSSSGPSGRTSSAELVDRVAHDAELRRRIVEGQRRAAREVPRRWTSGGFLLGRIEELVR